MQAVRGQDRVFAESFVAFVATRGAADLVELRTKSVKKGGEEGELVFVHYNGVREERSQKIPRLLICTVRTFFINDLNSRNFSRTGSCAIARISLMW